MDRPTIVPTLFYKDPIAALKFLEQAFGFETTSLVVDAEGRLGHSEVDCLGGVISVGSEFAGSIIGSAQMTSPAALGGAGTQFLRINMASGIDEHCERARAAGARITQEPENQFYGARVYRALDPEGHVWNFSQEVATPSVAEMEQATGLKFHDSIADAGVG